MAKYEVRRLCGHTEIIQLYGPHKDRLTQYAAEKMKLCRECYLEERRQEHEALAEELGLPELAGTEKQVAWANSLRLGWAQRYLARLRAWRGKEVSEAELDATKQAIAEVLSTKTDAKWWIEHRDEIGALLRPELERLLRAISRK